MSLVLTGLSHHTSPIALRERLAFTEETTPGALQGLRQRLDNAGAVILSTCNRVEVYVHHPNDPNDLHLEIRKFLAEWHDVDDRNFDKMLYDHRDRDVAAHLFRVASSLDSLVVGEQQILGQVHDAYLLAHAEQATDKVISTLFQRAFSVAKRVRTQSNIGAGKVSISSVAVDLAVSIFAELKDKTVLVIGSGEMAELTLRSLFDHGAGHLIVANRSLEKAQSLAEQYRGDAVSLDLINDHLHRADIVISSTAAADKILTADDFQDALKQRRQAPMFVIDIAVPRDIDAAVEKLDNVYLYDVDELQETANKNLEARRNEIEHCLQIIDDGVAKFEKWMHSLAAEPTIVSMSRELNTIRERELEKTLSSLSDLTEEERQEVEYLTKRITNAILQRPMTQLKQEVAQRDPSHHSDILHLVRRLFGLKEST